MAAISESTASETAASSTTKSAAEEAGRALASAGPVTKLIVAIHGIGDQYRYATIRSVVTRFGRHFDFPAATPLGSFYAPDGSISAFRLPAPPDPPGGLGGIGFAEVYWADIPRAIQKKGYTIEEAKAWAGTVVERIRARYGPELKKQFDFQSEDFRDAANVLLEMIETIKILANLLFLAEKMGFPKFDLDDLLTSYLGDVQLVADFPAKRQKILQRFSDVLDALWKGVLLKQESKPEIYIVAHSEGTVIAFMALLRAMSLPTRGEVAPPPRPEWIDQVRGFMTIGSPIDKHLILWPSVWDAYNTPGPPVNPPIRWRNYYDYGDPVGFDLDTARDWMKDHRWNPAFEFEQKDDFGFSRYPLPGAAHNDYWSDEVVFGHFIQTVVGAPPALGCDFTAPKWNRNLARIFSYVSPYLLAFLLLYGGTCLLAKALQAYAAPAPAPHPATSAAAAPAANTLRGKPYVVQWWYKVPNRRPIHDLVRRGHSERDRHFLSPGRHDDGRSYPAPHAQDRVASARGRALRPLRRALRPAGGCADALLAWILPWPVGRDGRGSMGADDRDPAASARRRALLDVVMASAPSARLAGTAPPRSTAAHCPGQRGDSPDHRLSGKI